MKWVSLLLVVSLAFGISTSEAKKHIGEYQEVCGKVDGVYHHRNGHIFLNLDGKYPHQKMSVVIWKRYVNEFSGVEFLGKKICVKGVIKEYKGVPEMFLKNRYQVEFK